jgi:chromosomal replication initiator protein
VLPDRIRGLLDDRIGRRRAELWFDSAATVRVDDGKLAVHADSAFAADWIRRHFGGDLTAVSREALGREDFDLRVRESAAAPLAAPERAAASEEAGPPKAPDRDAMRPAPRHAEAWRRLEDFVPGPTNQMAFEAARTFAASDAMGNGLVVHGPCGVGKTHLLQGVCRARRASRPQHRVRYLTAEQFTNEYIQSVRHGTIDAFRARVRRVDLLAIDDVHFLAGKTATQNEFLHTLDAVQLSGAQVMLASDEHPHLVRRLAQSLISRMLAGMVVRIDPPDRALRLALVRLAARRRGLELSAEAQDAVAAKCVGGARHIEGVVASLEAMRSLHGAGSVTGDMIDALFQREDAALGDHPVRIGEIIAQVCRATGVDAPQLAGAGRHRRVTLARGLIAWLARRHTTMSFPEIARAIGVQSHSSVHASAARIDALLAAGAVIDRGAAGDGPAVELIEGLRHELRGVSRQRRG